MAYKTTDEIFAKWDAHVADLEKNKTDGYIIYKNGQKETIPHGIKTIEDEAFLGNKEIVSVALPNSVEIIGDFAFCGCAELRELKLPDSVSFISIDAISFCPLLETLYLSEYVTEVIGSFSGCISLKNINVNVTNPCFTNKGNCLISTFEKEVIWGGNNSFIPNDGSVTTIGQNAFYGCTFQHRYIPKSIETIKKGAFERCTSLIALYIHDTIKSIEKDAFTDCPSLVIYYEGTQEQWDTVFTGDGVSVVPNAPMFKH